jgi:hypothetical protein
VPHPHQIRILGQLAIQTRERLAAHQADQLVQEGLFDEGLHLVEGVECVEGVARGADAEAVVRKGRVAVGVGCDGDVAVGEGGEGQVPVAVREKGWLVDRLFIFLSDL